MTSAPTVAARPHTGKLLPVHDVFYRGPHNQVVQRVVTDGVPGPEYDLGATLHPDATVAATWRSDGQRLDLFARRHDSALVQRTFTWVTGWGEWHVVHEAGLIASDPSATWRPAELNVFYMTADELELLSFRRSGEFSTQRSLAGTLDTGPAAITRGESIAHVFGYGRSTQEPDTRLGQWRRTDWLPWNWWPGPDPGDRAVSSTPAAFAPDSRTVTVVIRTDGSGLSTVTGTADSDTEPFVQWSGWHDYTAPSPAGSAAALLSTPNGRGLVYLRGHDNTLVVRALDVTGR